MKIINSFSLVYEKEYLQSNHFPLVQGLIQKMNNFRFFSRS